MNDELGQRMKVFEEMCPARRLVPLLPAIARLDGRSFHSFTKNLSKPYDRDFQELMVALCHFLVEESVALVGYTQSDEISLLWYSNNYASQIFFDGKVQKMVSTLSALASAKMQQLLPEYLPEKTGSLPTFDCRVFNVPTLEEATNYFIWREVDAKRNSFSSACGEHFSHKQLFGKNMADMHEMLHSVGINWSDYPTHFKRGVYIRREVTLRKFSEEERAALPERHEARQNPDLEVERSELLVKDFPPMTRIQNRVDVLFSFAEPILKGGLDGEDD